MSSDITYPVNEIFASIQGEGYHTGRPPPLAQLLADWDALRQASA